MCSGEVSGMMLCFSHCAPSPRSFFVAPNIELSPGQCSKFRSFSCHGNTYISCFCCTDVMFRLQPLCSPLTKDPGPSGFDPGPIPLHFAQPGNMCELCGFWELIIKLIKSLQKLWRESELISRFQSRSYFLYQTDFLSLISSGTRRK